jgi:hypothetical protein
MYSVCLVKKIFILLENLLNFLCQYSPVGNYWHILMYESVFCIVYMVYYSLDSLTVGLGCHWHRNVNSLVASYWMCTAMCMYEGQYGSAVYGVFLYTIHNSDAICCLSYLLIFKYIFGSVFLHLIWLFTVIFAYVTFKNMQPDMNK